MRRRTGGRRCASSRDMIPASKRACGGEFPVGTPPGETMMGACARTGQSLACRLQQLWRTTRSCRWRGLTAPCMHTYLHARKDIKASGVMSQSVAAAGRLGAATCTCWWQRAVTGAAPHAAHAHQCGHMPHKVVATARHICWCTNASSHTGPKPGHSPHQMVIVALHCSPWRAVQVPGA